MPPADERPHAPINLPGRRNNYEKKHTLRGPALPPIQPRTQKFHWPECENCERAKALVARIER
jgi:hypothetical protein